MMRRREFLGTLAVPAIGEEDGGGIKIAHRVQAGISDDDLLFLKQIGLRWARVESASWLTVNEKRRATGYEDLGPAGDVLLVPSTLTPLEQAVEEPVFVPDALKTFGVGHATRRQKSAVPFLAPAPGLEMARSRD